MKTFEMKTAIHFGDNALENIIFLTSFLQWSGNQINHFALHYKRVCNDKNSLVWNALKTFQCIIPKMNGCFHFKGLHIAAPFLWLHVRIKAFDICLLKISHPFVRWFPVGYNHIYIPQFPCYRKCGLIKFCTVYNQNFLAP